MESSTTSSSAVEPLTVAVPLVPVVEQDVITKVPQTAANATIADTVKNAASSVAQAVNESGAIPKAKQVASSITETLASSARKTGNVMAEVFNPIVEVPQTETETIIEEVPIPYGATVVVPEGTRVVVSPSEDIALQGHATSQPIGQSVTSGAQAAASAAGHVAGSVVGTVSATADLVKNAAVSATNKVLGTETRANVGTAVSNADANVKETALHSADTVRGSLGNAKNNVNASVENVEDTMIERTPSSISGPVSGTIESAKQYASGAADSVRGMASETSTVAQKAVAGDTVPLQQKATSALSMAGSVAGSVVGSVAGTVVAATNMATHAASSMLGRNRHEVVDADVLSRDLPFDELTPQERGVIRAHEIENRAAEKTAAVTHTVQEAAATVSHSKPVVATREAANHSFDVAVEKTTAVGTVAGDMASRAYDTAAAGAATTRDTTVRAAHATQDVAATGYNKVAGTTKTVYDTTANTVAATTDSVRGVVGTVYNKAANTASATTESVKNQAGSAYNKATETAAAATESVRSTAGSVYNKAANTGAATTESVKSTTVGSEYIAGPAYGSTRLYENDALYETPATPALESLEITESYGSVLPTESNSSVDYSVAYLEPREMTLEEEILAKLSESRENALRQDVQEPIVAVPSENFSNSESGYGSSGRNVPYVSQDLDSPPNDTTSTRSIPSDSPLLPHTASGPSSGVSSPTVGTSSYEYQRARPVMAPEEPERTDSVRSNSVRSETTVNVEKPSKVHAIKEKLIGKVESKVGKVLKHPELVVAGDERHAAGAAEMNLARHK